jgi:tripartite-type tricarboxylate transporter receptor subunit TctC
LTPTVFDNLGQLKARHEGSLASYRAGRTTTADTLIVTSFFGVVAPGGTPSAIVTKLNAAINESLKSPATVASMRRLGVEPSIGSPQEFSAFIEAELKKWAAVAQTSSISID